jgi:uncharacterized damage-inducible protein DinB
MRHTREEVMQRTTEEFERLDQLVARLSQADWQRPVPRPETKDAWTVKDALAHITHWKADVVRAMQGKRRPPEERGLNITDGNRLVYEHWRERPPEEVLAWHRQVQAEVLSALRSAPDEWFSGKERRPDWPFDLDGHVNYHRVKDIEEALADSKKKNL